MIGGKIAPSSDAANDFVAAPAQNGDGLRADQARAADDDDLHGLPSLVDDGQPSNGFECKGRKYLCALRARINP